MKKTSDRGALEEFSRDAGIITIRPKVAYFAESEEDVAQALREASDEGIPVTARGGGTSIPSQSVGHGAILLQARTLVELRADGTAVCQPGVVKAEFNRMIGAGGRWMPVDPSSYASCTLGGMLANNSSGVRTLKYGSTVDYVKGLRIVTPGKGPVAVAPMSVEQALSAEPRTRRVASLIVENRDSIEEDRPHTTKNSSGYRIEGILHDGVFDLPKLFVGSEGTLCVITEGTLSTRIPPKWRVLLIVESSLDELDGVAGLLREHAPSALELVDKSVFRTMNRWDRIAKYSRSERTYMVFCEFDGEVGESSKKVEELASSKAAGLEPLVLSSASEISEAWEARNETLSIAQDMKKGTKVLVPGVEDLTVPPERLGDVVKLLVNQFEGRGLDYISYGHAGDANLHARPLLDLNESGDRSTHEGLMEDCFEAVWRMKGSITGEHGDGMLRAKYVERQYPNSYWIMREVKSLYDPKGLLNPGVKIS